VQDGVLQASSNLLDLRGDYLGVLLLQIGFVHALVVERASVLVRIAVLTAKYEVATALEPEKTHFPTAAETTSSVRLR